MHLKDSSSHFLAPPRSDLMELQLSRTLFTAKAVIGCQTKISWEEAATSHCILASCFSKCLHCLSSNLFLSHYAQLIKETSVRVHTKRNAIKMKWHLIFLTYFGGILTYLLSLHLRYHNCTSDNISLNKWNFKHSGKGPASHWILTYCLEHCWHCLNTSATAWTCLPTQGSEAARHSVTNYMKQD